MRARTVTVGEISERDVALWTDLVGRAVDPYPAIDPRFLVASAPHRESVESMQVLFVEDESSLVAVMPILVRRTEDRIPLTVVTTRTTFFEGDSARDHPLLDAGRPVEAMEAILLGLRSERLPPLVEFYGMPAGGVLEDALVSASRRLGNPLVERERREYTYIRSRDDEHPEIGSSHEIDAGADADLPSFGLAHTSSHTRRNYARLARRLIEQTGSVLRYSDRSDDPEAIEQFIELQNSGWKGDPTRGGESLRIRERDAWFRAVTDRYRADGDLIVYALTSGSELIHVAVNLRVRDAAFAWVDAFNEEYAPFKAGSLGRIANINRVLADPAVRSLSPDLVDRNHAANEFFPDQGQRIKILSANGGARARGFVRTLPVARKLRDRLRDVRTRSARS